MDNSEPVETSIDLAGLAHRANVSVSSVSSVIELLDDGNTVPFITRYRKDNTGGLDERQILLIKEEVERERMLLQRKETILKSISSQNKLTDELAKRIHEANSIKLLEDLYLPFKPKKRTLATVALQRGLEPLSNEIMAQAESAADLETRAADFIQPDQELHSVQDVLTGVRHILAERFSERAEARGRLRDYLEKNGRLTSKRVSNSSRGEGKVDTLNTVPAAPSFENASASPIHATVSVGQPNEISSESFSDLKSASVSSAVATADGATTDGEATAPDQADATATIQVETASSQAESSPTKAEIRRKQRKEAREKKRRRLQQAFKDYFEFEEGLSRIPHHRILAINRGERAKILRVKIEVDDEKIHQEAERLLLPENHRHIEFLKDCLRDALQRLLMPSLERDIRRERTQLAEEHAVKVFARNLAKLLLQAPVRAKRVLAVDPGLRFGCKLAALDEFGNVLDHCIVNVIGDDGRRKEGRARLANLVRKHGLNAVAIGNGTGCREAERLVASVIEEELSGFDIAYVIVNEAGASVYSTSDIAREELPEFDATMRGAVSIGRRLLDPLSELVKINPSNIGVGLYQHDVKSKPLRDSLQAVVRSCVNYVGVDVNTASPSLLSYVSGLNQLTARRLYEYRREHGPFQSREQLKQIPGIGEATFVQAAGFLKVTGGDNPLDSTWIHPESYEVAQRLLQQLDVDVAVVAETMVKHSRPSAATTAAENSDAASPTGSDPPLAPLASRLESAGRPNSSKLAADEIENLASASTESEPLEPSLDQSTIGAADETREQEVLEDRDKSAPRIPDAEASTVQHATVNGEESGKPSPDSSTKEDDDTSSNSPRTAAVVTDLLDRIKQVDLGELSQNLNIGRLLLDDLIVALSRPGRDPRDDLPPPKFRRGILKLEDLEPQMELTGTVLNVVDFGAFVDIGLSDSGLVHVSRLADRFVRDPHEIVGVGDQLNVWVIGVDKERRRVSLTAIEPGTEKPREQRKTERRHEAKKSQDGKPARKPRRQDRKPRSVDDSRRVRSKRERTARPKPKPRVPITKAMEEGTEPMRTFSDLIQFYEKKKPNSGESESTTEGGDKK